MRYTEFLKQIPDHLRQYVVEQDYGRYTAVEQATWRYTLRQLKSFLSKYAHPCYVEGLEKTGISVEAIPRIDEMCEKLQKFGWTAVPVSGFIPPSAFMELQSLSILPIACDMRTVDHILYTPAPDIVHEAAGHAPILVDPQFAAYLKEYALVAKKAIVSSEDLAQYEAIRELSDIKEDSSSTPEQIKAAEEKLDKVTAAMTHASEAALLGRMNWWTAEYGLIGEPESPKIFGAGLLSSVGEASQCLSSKVKKIPLTVDCVNTSYDITEPQPQLFVAKTFADLTKVLHQLREQMAYKCGGLRALEIARKSGTVNTIELNSGLQISGKLTEAMVTPDDEPYFFKITGPAQLSVGGRQLPGHGKDYHKEGFSSPLGMLRRQDNCISRMSAEELQKLNIEKGKNTFLTFISGVEVSGYVTNLTFTADNRLVLITLTNCTVQRGGRDLYKPEWGPFDMAVGTQVISVYSGPADRASFGLTDSFVRKTVPQKNYSSDEQLKFSIYQALRDIREARRAPDTATLEMMMNHLQNTFPGEWLAYLEIYELAHKFPQLESYKALSKAELARIKGKSPHTSAYIDLGIQLAGQ